MQVMYTAEAIGGIIGVFTGQVDAKIKGGTPNTGQHPPKIASDLRTEQRYVNGNTDLGRMSVTVIERYKDEEPVVQHFTLSNSKTWAGEDAPDAEELDEAITYKLWVNTLEGHYGAEFSSYDNAGFKAHLDAFHQIPLDDDEAREAHMEKDDDFDFERALEPSEVEYMGYLLTQVISTNE